ncbi:hypothetical protein H5410_050607 [Solanum commersonii]|uniref:Uncharacterized protein n=1 Tax=Solanum commersonii TaxID=4109 RepID=A0A9J5WY36_SOLCO|nr:hypothetical protein H5410_050607 [Solanum commersonii]
MRPSMRPLNPNSPQKTQQMARPFEVPPSGVLPQKLTVPRGINSMMDIGFQNRYAALADYPRLQVTTPTKLINQKIEQGTTSSSVQTKESYTMKAPETFAQAYEGTHIANLIKPVYLSNNYVDTDNPLKTQRYFEGILVDTESIIIEHTMSDKNPEYVSYSRFTIKRVLSPSEWYTDRLLTPITLLMPHKPQTYNWHDYKSAWFYIRLGHT